MKTLTLTDAELDVLISTLSRAVSQDTRIATAATTDPRVAAAMPDRLMDRLVANSILLDTLKVVRA